MSRARSSAVWNYFTVDNVCDKKAVCNYCKKTLSYKSTITNLKLHLKQKHLSVYEEFCIFCSFVSNQNQTFFSVTHFKTCNTEKNCTYYYTVL